MSSGNISYSAVVIARMTSSRLPGKTLADVNGRPLIGYLLETLQQVRPVLDIVIATSSEETDDPIEKYADDSGVRIVRGDLMDVAGRMCLALKATGCDAGFRVNGDSPLVQKELFENAISIYENEDCDLVTNIWPRSYPPGVSVELLNAVKYQEAYQQIVDPEDKEHVTRFLYQNADNYRIRNMESEIDYSEFDFAIDQPSDLERLRKIVGAMDRHHSSYSLAELTKMFAEFDGS